MNIGIYLKLIPPEAGGGFTWSDELMKALASAAPSQHHRFVLLCQGSGVVPIEPNSSISVVTMGSLVWRRILAELSVTHAGQDIQMLLKRNFSFIAPGLLKKQKIDMVWFPAGSLFTRVDAPYVATMWDSQHRLQPWFPEVNSRGEWLLRERHYELFLKQASYVLAGNEASRYEIERFYGIAPERIRLLPHPVPEFALNVTAPVRSDIIDKFSIGQSFFFFPAQFWPHKNHHALVKAVHLLKEKYGLRVSVVLSGSDKGNRRYVEQVAAACGIDRQIHFVGFVSRNDLIFLYQHALALVVPSFFGPENFPPLEAFALGCPVIAADVAGAREQYEDAALLFDPKNIDELMHHMRSILDDPSLRSDLISRGRTRALKWNAGSYIKKMLSLFDEFENIRSSWHS